MRKLPFPINDDNASIDAISNNQRLGSYPHIRPFSATIKQAYADYAENSGVPYLINPPSIPDDIGDYLSRHYDSPPQCISFIKHLRINNEAMCCPLCGSLHGGTLDHFIPKSTHSIFSIYSRNIVPACKCNIFKSDAVPEQPSHRFLHPYFDDVLTDRLIVACFTNLGPTPSIEIKICIPETNEYYNAVKFHVDRIVLKTAIKEHIRKKWSDLCRRPELAVRAFSPKPVDINQFMSIIEEERDLIESEHGSKNSWDSAFISGLLERDVAIWIFEKLIDPRRRDGTPLIYGLSI